MMFGLQDKDPRLKGEGEEQTFEPLVSDRDIQVMSMGSMLPDATPVIWRGPMLSGSVLQFAQRTNWHDLDYLIVDFPPGTGDIPMTLAEKIPLVGFVLVSTPERVSVADARRARRMMEKLDIPVLGAVRNMAWLVCPSCGEDIHTHGELPAAGTTAAVQLAGVPLLGNCPQDPLVRGFADIGRVGELLSRREVSQWKEAIENIALQVAVSVHNLLEQPLKIDENNS